MARELDLRLMSTPTVELPNVGLGDLSGFSDAQRAAVRELASLAQRRTLAAQSKAMPDGSFPIRNVPDLKLAVQAYGLSRNKPRTKRFIVRRARALSRADLLPETWGVQPATAVLAAGEGGPSNGVMVALYPPPDVAATLAGNQPDDLTPDDLHVTLAYLGTTDEVTPEQINAAREAIANVANAQTPFQAQVQGVGTFHAPESDNPQWYSVDAPGLAELRTQIVQALESVGVQPRVEHDFTPHMTVRYGGEQPELSDGGTAPWPVDGVVLAAGPAHEVYSFGHDYLPDGGDDPDCLLCGQPQDFATHAAGPPPAWMDAMDNPALNVGEMVGEDGTKVEFVAAPGPCSLDRSSKHNWVEDQGGLPNYICQVARAVARGGHSLDSAIPIAVATIKKWAAGGSSGNGKAVSAAVQGRASSALAEWEAKKAKAHANGADVEEFGFRFKHGWIRIDGGKDDKKVKKPSGASPQETKDYWAARKSSGSKDTKDYWAARKSSIGMDDHATPEGVTKAVQPSGVPTAEEKAAEVWRIKNRISSTDKGSSSMGKTGPRAALSVLDLETADFGFRFKHGWIRVDGGGDNQTKNPVKVAQHASPAGVTRASSTSGSHVMPPPESPTMRMAREADTKKQQRILAEPVRPGESATMRQAREAGQGEARRRLAAYEKDAAEQKRYYGAASLAPSAGEFGPSLLNLPKNAPLTHGTAQAARTGSDGTITYTDGYVWDPKSGQATLPTDPQTGQPMNQPAAKALLAQQIATDKTSAAQTKAQQAQAKQQAAQTAAQQKAQATQAKQAAATQQKAAAAQAKAAAPKAAAPKAAAPKAAPKAAAPKAAPKAAAPKKAAPAGGSSSGRSYNRKPSGAAGGGQFAPGPARNGAAAQIQADPQAAQLYSSLMGATPGARAGQVQGLSDANLQKLTQIAYSSKTADPNVVAARVTVANEMAKRGFDVKHYGALGGGLSAKGLRPAGGSAPALPTARVPSSGAGGAPGLGRAVAASAEFAWNPDIHSRDKHGRRIAKGHKVASPTGESGTVLGNAPGRGQHIVQVTQPKGPPVSVPAEHTEVLTPEDPTTLDDQELGGRHAAISNDIAGHLDAEVSDARQAAQNPAATVPDYGRQSEITRLKAKRQPYVDEIAKRTGGTVTSTVASAATAPDADTYSYYWNPDTEETFRIAEDGNMSVFAPAVDEQEQPSWQAIDSYNGATHPGDVQRLPRIEDPATLEAILGSTLALIADGAPVAVADEPTDIVTDETDEPEEEEDTTGRRFRIPIVIPEGVPSGDRRQFAEGALEAKECPMPLLWQRETDDGHKRSVTVGRIDAIERLEGGGLGNAEGVFDTHADAQEAARQVRERFLTGVSGDVDKFESELSQAENGEDSLLIKHGRLVAATLVAKPAFQEATIEMIPEEGESPVITAAGGPLLPPKSWFFRPGLDGPTPLSVNEDGRVYGHIAEWGTPHLGNPQLKPPRSTSNYRYFNRKPLRTAEGDDVRVGQLTLVGGHAKMSYDPDRAVKHYDDTNSAVADVVAGEDEFGIWVSGAMRPGVTPEQLRAFRASEPSGDWRMRDGNLELCAICQVNVAGFPVTPKALIASGGEVVALVAAGMVGRESRQLDVHTTIAELAAEVAALRAERDQERRAALLETVQSLRS